MESRQFQSGPFLSAAVFCEKLLQEADGVKSAIRIVDRLTIEVAGPQPPADMPAFPYQVVLFLRFKSGAARGPMPLEVRVVNPSGESKPVVNNTLMFEGEDDRGIDAVCKVSLKFQYAGIYWFYINLGGVTLTRVPFRVIYLPQIKQAPFPGTGTP